MTPAVEPTVFPVVASRFIWLALRAAMAVDAFWVVTVGSVVAWCHSGNLSEDLSLIVGNWIVVSMSAMA